MTDVRAMTKAQGEMLHEYLQGVPDDKWDATTVCDPWTVRHLVAHMTALGNQTLPNFMKGMIKNGFNFEKVVNGDLQKWLLPRDEMVTNFAASVANPTTPKMLNHIALGELVCHGEDIRRALGDRGDHPAAHIEELGPEYVTQGGPLGVKKRIAGLSLRATDGDFTHGEGPEVAGPGIDLILAMAGRGHALDTCEGDGVETLRSRC